MNNLYKRDGLLWLVLFLFCTGRLGELTVSSSLLLYLNTILRHVSFTLSINLLSSSSSSILTTSQSEYFYIFSFEVMFPNNWSVCDLFQIIDEEETQFMTNCPPAVTESTPRRRTSIQVFWTAPPSGSGCIYLKYVQKKPTVLFDIPVSMC